VEGADRQVSAALVEPVTLTGQHVRLEPLDISHVDALWTAGKHPDIWRYTIAPMHTLADMQAYVEGALADHAAGRALPFVQVEQAGGRVVGSTRFGNIELAHHRVEIGWTWLTPAYQRTAINTEAKLLLLTHAFETWNCLRVELKTDARNEKSRKAMERMGAKYEGTLRRHIRNADGFQRDSVYYSIIAEEWPDVQAALQAKLAG
jgi:N-acetyltransferase